MSCRNAAGNPSRIRRVFIPLFLVWVATSLAFAQSPWTPPPIEHCVSIRDGKSGARLTMDELFQRLATADAVFLGETHDDDTTHRFQLAVYEGLLKQRNQKVVLAMEMFERDVQDDLDRYLSGELDESKFLSRSRPWGNYREAYRPLVEAAKSAGAPVVAANFPRPLRMKMMQDGKAALEQLGDHRDWAPQQFLENTPLYWKRTDNAVRGHLEMMRASEGEDRRYTTQSLWDNSMGESCAQALDQHPGHAVVHLNGGFHTQYWDGTAGQLRQRKPDAKIATIAITPAQSPASAELTGAPVADFVVFAESRATNFRDDHWSVFVARKNDYQLYLPPEASADRPVPLLIWLSDDGLTAQEGLELWRAQLGSDVAILAIDPPYRERQRDLSSGGRWFWADRFAEDVGAMVETIERAWSYALSRYPVDPERVCLAGEGTGATVAAATTLLTSRMSLRGVAIEPRQYSKIKDFPLPLLEDWGDQSPPQRRLQILGNPELASWWQDELQQYGTVGLPAEWSDLAADRWAQSQQVVNAVRDGLGLPAQAADAHRRRQYLVADFRSPLHLHWARLAAARLTNDQTLCVAVPEQPDAADVQPAATALDPAAVAGSLPLCPGPFGGTTVLVLGQGTDAATVARWRELLADDPIQKRSRFHRLRVATLDPGDVHLYTVLQELRGQNRNNVLVVPAEFHAAEPTMRQMEELVSELADQMTIHWLPGLGGQIGAAKN